MQLATQCISTAPLQKSDALDPHYSLRQALLLSEAGTVKMDTVHAAEGQ